MPRLLIAGDTHGNLDQWRYLAWVALEHEVDGIVQVGDFGYRFQPEFVAGLNAITERLGVPIRWVDGNHDSHLFIGSRLDEMGSDRTAPVALWDTAPNVIYVPRGATWELHGRRFMGLGGAVSTDRDGSIGRPARVVFEEWWPDEALTHREVERAIAQGEVDVLFCHDAPAGVDYLESTLFDESSARRLGAALARECAANRSAVAAVAEHCKPNLIIHGHLHHRYSHVWRCNGRDVPVVGLDRDGRWGDSWEVLNL